MLACFFQGLTCFLLASTSRSLQILLRVVDGSIMSSTKPKTNIYPVRENVDNILHMFWKNTKKWLILPLTAAGKGLANFSTYSASASACFSFPLKIIWTAPWEKHKQIIHSVKWKEGGRGKLKGLECFYLGTHDSNLSCGPGVVHISSQVFGAHHIIGSSISLRIHTHTHTTTHQNTHLFIYLTTFIP